MYTEVFKILTDRGKVDKYQSFTSSTSHLRGHCLKLSNSRSSRQVRQNFFSQQIINSWNDLPSNIVMSTSVNVFKNRLDQWRGERYDSTSTRTGPLQSKK